MVIQVAPHCLSSTEQTVLIKGPFSI